MAPRKWEGILTVEGEQTGDGRFLVEGSIEWSDLPLPLGFLEEQMHGDALSGGVQIGVIETITRVGDEIQATGVFDDEIPQAVELIRRMEAGTAPHGNEVYVSIDPDNWDVEIVATEQEEDDGVILIASGTGELIKRKPVTAAAGDGDPQDEDAVVLFEDSVDSIIERYTRLRIRGATCLSIPALDRAVIRLADGGTGANEEPVEQTDETEEAATASVPPSRESILTRSRDAVLAAAIPQVPPAEWFEDPKLPELTPFTVAEDGRVFGHLAPWGECHIGVEGKCVTAPTSPSDYAYFRTGAIMASGCDCEIPVGVITMATGHENNLQANHRAAAEHYDNTGTAVADVAIGEDLYGPWVAGALRPGVDADQVRALRASALSGDWRPVGGHLELVAALAVNVPGFPIPRARAHIASGRVTALVAAGVEQMAALKDPAQREMAEFKARLEAVEHITKPLRAVAQKELAARIRSH